MAARLQPVVSLCPTAARPAPPPVGALGDAELLSLLVTGDAQGRGGPGGAILRLCGGLAGLVDATTRELVTIPGLGTARARRVLAAVELGRRVTCRAADTGLPLRSSTDVHALLAPRIAPLSREVFTVLALDVRARVLGEHRVAEGGLQECPVDPRDVFRPLVRQRAASCILAHNHPSGDPTPSVQDRMLTLRMAEAGRLLGVRVVDHVVVATGGWYSFRDEGVL
jgi:DNA repair protein RadC